MLFPPYSHLKALPDFSAFQFKGIGSNGTSSRQLRFLPSKKSDIVNVDMSDLRNGSMQPSLITDQKDLFHIQATIIQVIELYTEKYPDKIIRLCGGTRDTIQLFQGAIANHLEKLLPFFEIHPEKEWIVPFKKKSSSNAFLIKRKPDWLFSIHTVSTTLCSHSVLFGRNVHVELSKHVEIAFVSPLKD